MRSWLLTVFKFQFVRRNIHLRGIWAAVKNFIVVRII